MEEILWTHTDLRGPIHVMYTNINIHTCLRTHVIPCRRNKGYIKRIPFLTYINTWFPYVHVHTDIQRSAVPKKRMPLHLHRHAHTALIAAVLSFKTRFVHVCTCAYTCAYKHGTSQTLTHTRIFSKHLHIHLRQIQNFSFKTGTHTYTHVSVYV